MINEIPTILDNLNFPRKNMLNVMIIIKKSISIDMNSPFSLKNIAFPERVEIVHGIPKQSYKLII